eukprot:1186752-Pyramimonas_sp.AAC.1
MLNWSISFLARTFRVPPCRPTVALCCGVAADVVIRRQPMSSSYLENSRSNSPPKNRAQRPGDVEGGRRPEGRHRSFLSEKSW